MPSRWVEATTGHAATCPEGDRATSADSSRRKSTRSSARISRPEAKAAAQSSGVSTNQTPLPSYPPRVVFRTHGSPNASTSATEVTSALRGQGMPSSASRCAHHALVLGVHERLRPRTYGDPVGRQRVQVLGRHVLVVEGDHLAALGDRAQVGEVGVVADELVGDDLRGRDAVRLRQQAQGDPHRRRGLGEHPGQLAATDDGDGGGRP